MEPTQPTTTPPPVISASNPGMFGTKIPSSVAFAVAVLLFFLPFAEIKCGGKTIAKNSGFGIAMGKKWEEPDSKSLNPFGTTENKSSGVNDKNDDNKSQIYALVALGLGVIGFLLSFTSVRAAIGAAMISGLLAAAALIVLMLHLQSQVKDDSGGAKKGNDDGGGFFGLDKLNDTKVTIDFTPWFYVAVIAFLAAAFFSYRRMASKKT